MKFKFLAVAAALSLGVSAQAAQVSFAFNYTDAAGTGFLDATYGAQRQAALGAAAAYWSSTLKTSVDRTFNVNVLFNSAATSLTPLASTSRTYQTVGDYQYASSLAEYLGSAGNGSAADFTLTFSSSTGNASNGNFNMVTGSYLGLDRNPGADQFDFQTVAQRGIARGLGFDSRIDTNTTNAITDGVFVGDASGISRAGIYDSFLVQKQGSTFISLLGMSNANRFAALSSGELYWNGAYATAANGGSYVKLSASQPSATNGSVNGNNVIYTDASQIGLMTVQYPPKGQAMDADPVTLGMLQDMGWQIAAVPEPATYAMLLAGLGMIGFAARSRRA